MSYQIITITGRLVEAGEPYEIAPNRKAQRIVIECTYNDPRVKTDYFAVFAYGLDIRKLWEQFNTDHPPHSCTVTAKLNGRMKANRNTLTLTLKNILWNYE